jgi:hypothetical protein
VVAEEVVGVVGVAGVMVRPVPMAQRVPEVLPGVVAVQGLLGLVGLRDSNGLGVRPPCLSMRA